MLSAPHEIFIESNDSPKFTDPSEIYFIEIQSKYEVHMKISSANSGHIWGHNVSK